MNAADQTSRAVAAATSAAKKVATKAAPRPPAKKATGAARAATAPKAPKATEATPAPQADKAAKPSKAGKPAREKLVRDSFTMPQADYARIGALKARALQAQRPAKKSELLRAGLHVLEGLAVAELVKALNRLVSLKPGRPKKSR